MDETYIKVAAQLKYLYRVVDRAGDTVNFLMTAKRDKAAARRFLESAINLHGLPEKITIDKSGANTAAIYSVNEDACLDIELRQCKCLPDGHFKFPQAGALNYQLFGLPGSDVLSW
jgi:putative transposase